MDSINVTALGHGCLRVQIEDQSLIIDPCFDPQLPLGVKRATPVPASLETLREATAILVTSPHHHRLSWLSLGHFKQAQTRLVVPFGLGEMVQRYFIFPTTELKPMASFTLGRFKITALPSLHHAFRRNIFKPWPSCHYLITVGEQNLLYVSDTPYRGSQFHEWSQTQSIDVAFLPIDHTGPDWMAGQRYMSAEQAVQAALDLKAKVFTPVAYGAYNWSKRKPQQALQRFEKAVEQQQLQAHCQILQLDQTVDYRALIENAPSFPQIESLDQHRRRKAEQALEEAAHRQTPPVKVDETAPTTESAAVPSDTEPSASSASIKDA